MKATVGILGLMLLVALAGCSSDDATNAASGPMAVRVAVSTNPVGCQSDVYWVSTPDGMSGQLLHLTSSAATDPEMVDPGTMLEINGSIICTVPGSSGNVDAKVEVMVGGNWQELPQSGTSSCVVSSGPGGCVIGFTSEVS